jgi:glycosyltransferase involved in cell wall biosynthesis
LIHPRPRNWLFNRIPLLCSRDLEQIPTFLKPADDADSVVHLGDDDPTARTRSPILSYLALSHTLAGHRFLDPGILYTMNRNPETEPVAHRKANTSDAENGSFRTTKSLEVAGRRVCFVTTTYPRYNDDPVPRFVADLAERLQSEHDVEVTVVAPHEEGLPREERAHGVQVQRFQYTFRAENQCLAYGYGIPDNLRRIPGARWQIPGFAGALGWKVTQQLPAIDLIHAHWLEPAVIATVANGLYRRPLVLSVHSAPSKVRWYHRWVLRSANKVLFNSHFTKSEMERSGCICDGQVCYQGFDDVLFNGAQPVGFIRSHLNLGAQATIVATVGRLIPVKGIDVLVRAAPAVLADRPDTHLVIAGDGPLRGELAAAARSTRCGDRIHFLGALPRDEIALLMADADVFTHPGVVDEHGRAEGLGVVVAEAMASRLACIGSNSGGIPELIVNGETGLVVEPGDPADLARSLGILLDDPGRRARMGRAGRARASDLFTCSAMASTVAGVYAEILNR